MGAVIGVFSPKGGVGKTLLATNLAVTFGVGQRRRTLLADLNSGLGNADLLLDLEPERSWEDLLPVLEEIHPHHVELAVTSYRAELDLLCCPRQVNPQRNLNPEGVTSLLTVLREVYEMIFLDTPPGDEETARKAFLLADLRLILLTPDAPALRGASRFLDSLPIRKKRTGLVINQYVSGAVISPEEVKNHLKKPLFAVLPIDSAGVWANVSYGDPCVLSKRSSLGKTIRQLAVRINTCLESR
jgi:pilus assembly protein CpaE